MNKNLLVVIILLGFIILTLIYQIIDKSVTIDHLVSDNKYQHSERVLLKNIATDLHNKNDKREIEEFLRVKYKTHMIKYESDSMLFIDEIGLEFKDNKFLKYVLMNN